MVLNKVTETAADVIGTVNKMAEHYDPSLEARTNTFGG
jgi:hypothetical protein